MPLCAYLIHRARTGCGLGAFTIIILMRIDAVKVRHLMDKRISQAGMMEGKVLPFVSPFLLPKKSHFGAKDTVDNLKYFFSVFNALEKTHVNIFT